ncbi:MAG TPA: DUF2723 domain-containing protein, partial [Kiritimatiellia bacterium]|nr:DUF2723 domain-containing protein [Kiritimatiellia bacterium]HMP33665.1 DUF2723 domain-containing protein [Kiritimatiellia bacterium]
MTRRQEHRLCVGGVTVAVFAAYLLTLNPTVSLEQAGALAVAADHVGIGKYPGYPVWHMVAHLFTRLFSMVTFHGHPNPVWATSLLSAVSGALACGMVTYLVLRISGLLVKSAAVEGVKPVILASAVAAGLLLAFSPVMWSQSVVTETHAFTVCYAAILLVVLVGKVSGSGTPGEGALMFLFGLGISVTPFLVLFAPVILVAMAWSGDRSWRIGLASMLVVALAIRLCLIQNDIRVAGGMLAGFVLFVVAGHGIPATRRLARSISGLGCGLLPYLYLPLAASHSPPMNMGAAYSWDGFRHLIGRGQYERIVLVNPLGEPGVILGETARLAERLVDQFMLPVAILGVLPLLVWPFFRVAWRPLSIVLVSLVGFALPTMAAVAVVPHDIQSQLLVTRVFLPVYLLWAVCVGVGFVMAYVLARGGRAMRLSKLFRNVPIVNSIEMSP